MLLTYAIDFAMWALIVVCWTCMYRDWKTNSKEENRQNSDGDLESR
jgi:hypothetical protein